MDRADAEAIIHAETIIPSAALPLGTVAILALIQAITFDYWYIQWNESAPCHIAWQMMSVHSTRQTLPMNPMLWLRHLRLRRMPCKYPPPHAMRQTLAVRIQYRCAAGNWRTSSYKKELTCFPEPPQSWHLTGTSQERCLSIKNIGRNLALLLTI